MSNASQDKTKTEVLLRNAMQHATNVVAGLEEYDTQKLSVFLQHSFIQSHVNLKRSNTIQYNAVHIHAFLICLYMVVGNMKSMLSKRQLAEVAGVGLRLGACLYYLTKVQLSSSRRLSMRQKAYDFMNIPGSFEIASAPEPVSDDQLPAKNHLTDLFRAKMSMSLAGWLRQSIQTLQLLNMQFFSLQGSFVPVSDPSSIHIPSKQTLGDQQSPHKQVQTKWTEIQEITKHLTKNTNIDDTSKDETTDSIGNTEESMTLLEEQLRKLTTKNHTQLKQPTPAPTPASGTASPPVTENTDSVTDTPDTDDENNDEDNDEDKSNQNEMKSGPSPIQVFYDEISTRTNMIADNNLNLKWWKTNSKKVANNVFGGNIPNDIKSRIDDIHPRTQASTAKKIVDDLVLHVSTLLPK